MYSFPYYNCTVDSFQREWNLGKSALRSYPDKSYYFLQYECEYGYEFLDEIKLLFCSHGNWLPKTLPKCVGKGACRRKNGGCSHKCHAKNNVEVECSCPKGMILGLDGRQCLSIPYQDDTDEDCKCFPKKNSNVMSCYCQKDRIPIGPPDVSITSEEPHEVIPGESLILTCKAESYMTPKIEWETSPQLQVQTLNEIPSEWMDKKFLSKRTKFSNISQNTIVSCVGRSIIGENRTKYEIKIKEPGAAPHVSYILTDGQRAFIWWQDPVVQTCPTKMCFIYYTTNRNNRLELWHRLSVEGIPLLSYFLADMPAFVLRDLMPNTEYFFRLRRYSGFGFGSYGPILSFKTSDAAMHNEPVILKKEINQNTVRIIWEPPPKYISNYIREYTIYYSNDLHIPLYLQYSKSVPSTEREITIRNLEPLTDYYILLKPQHHIQHFYPENSGVFDHFRTS
uniref:Fibronectin type-III domain-containing protein n=1 Tax=Syphacia muris TaxID=451379 RepID=A0A0N5AX09_9BILA